MFSGLWNRLGRILRFGWRVETRAPAPQPSAVARERLPVTHVILFDGTLGTLEPGHRTNIGLIHDLLVEASRGARLALYYDRGVQWEGWQGTVNVAMGRGINEQIRHAYGWLASRYHPGDRIFLFGYSRGAYAARSLAGIIGRIGLLRAAAATERNVRLAWRYYQFRMSGPGVDEFSRRFCEPSVQIEMIGVFDTVKALGVRLPFLWMWTEPQHEFHDHELTSLVRHGYHALALDETRAAYAPILWHTKGAGGQSEVEQVWFRGAHGDIGGQLAGVTASRPLSNIPLVWMLEHVERLGLPLPPDWRSRFPCDPTAPSVGTTRGWGKAFLLRARREVGRDPSECIHPTAERPSRRTRFGFGRPGRLSDQT